MAESKKSLFKPSHPKKYKGDITNIICRSTWEKKFCHYCDLNENVIEWGSEEFFIPYRAPDGKTRRYFPDFIMKVKRVFTNPETQRNIKVMSTILSVVVLGKKNSVVTVILMKIF